MPTANITTSALAELETLVRSGSFVEAAMAAADLADTDPGNHRVHWLWAQAYAFSGGFDVARRKLRHALDLAGDQGAGTETLARYRRWEGFVDDQERAFQRVHAFRRFFKDSQGAKRWTTNRPHPLEFFFRRGTFDKTLLPLRDDVDQLQVTAFNPCALEQTAGRLRAAGAAIENAARAESQPLLFLSDSHSRYFEWLIHEGMLPQTVAGVCSVSQANIYGLYMPSQDVQTRRQFLAALERFPEHAAIVLHIGEVDCRAIYWNLAARLGDIEEKFLGTILGNLERLLDEISRTHRRIVVTAPIVNTYARRPPTGEPLGKEIRRLTLLLAERLDEMCRRRGLPLASINDAILEFNGTLTNGYFRRSWDKRKMTHHCYPPKIATFWTEALTEALACYRA